VTYAVTAERAQRGAAWLFPLLGFAIPISTALDSAVLALIVLAWLVALPHAFPAWRKTLAIRPVAVAAALFALLAIGTFYSEVPAREAWKMGMKYSDFFLISVLLWTAAAMRSGNRALYLFLAAIVLNLIVSYSVANSLIERIPGLHPGNRIESIPGLHTYPAYPVGFKLSVTHNIFISFGAFVFVLLAREAKTTATRAPLIGLAILCAHNVLVIVIGRTGYLVLALLSAYFILVTLRTWQSRALALAFVAAFFVGAYSVSGSFQERISGIVSDLEQWTPGAADRTSVGQRIEYVRTSARIIAGHPLTGVGTGGFAAAYRGATESTLVTSNPHNDYAMIGVQVGLPGIALLVALYVLLWRDAGRLSSRLDRDLLRGMVLTMATAGFFNSVTLDHAEGLLLAWMVALVYARSDAATTA
jgi:O-antigen ligase